MWEKKLVFQVEIIWYVKILTLLISQSGKINKYFLHFTEML